MVCHRINQPWGKMSGRQALVGGDLHQAVYGPLGPEVLAEVLANPDRGGVTKKVCNGTDGHGVPTGFDAERVVYLQVTVTDAAGKVVFRSGDLDPNGDLRDDHSAYVHNGELPLHAAADRRVRRPVEQPD